MVKETISKIAATAMDWYFLGISTLNLECHLF